MRKNLASVLLGGVAGLLVINAYGMFFKPQAAAVGSSVALTQSPEGAASKQLNTGDARALTQDQLERRSRELQAREEAVVKAEGRRPATDEERHAQRVGTRQRALDTWQDMLSAHAAESVDPTWAKTTAAAFDDEFDKLTEEGNFAVRPADCRSKSCTVEVEFPSFAAARADSSTLVDHNYATNCAVHVVLPEPEEAAEGHPYVARYLFVDCQPPTEVAALHQSTR